VSYANLLQVEQSLARARGSMIHAWFEEIEWLESGPPAEDRLRRAAGRHRKPGIDLDRELDLFRKTIDSPNVRANLAEAEYRATVAATLFPKLADDLARGAIALEVHRERRITYRNGDELVNGIADRLVLYRLNGQVVAADVIDYKTDSVNSPSDVEGLCDLYRDQLGHYAEAMRRLYRLDVNRVAARLGLVSSGQFVTV
jgi:ATP-dependent exoDNAse (exonuclease V) beta subunit